MTTSSTPSATIVGQRDTRKIFVWQWQNPGGSWQVLWKAFDIRTGQYKYFKTTEPKKIES